MLCVAPQLVYGMKYASGATPFTVTLNSPFELEIRASPTRSAVMTFFETETMYSLDVVHSASASAMVYD